MARHQMYNAAARARDKGKRTTISCAGSADERAKVLEQKNGLKSLITDARTAVQTARRMSSKLPTNAIEELTGFLTNAEMDIVKAQEFINSFK